MALPQGRRSSNVTRLLRHGFTDPPAAQRLLDAPEPAGVLGDPVLLEALGATADPDLALRRLVRLLQALAEIPGDGGGDDKKCAGSRKTLLDTLVTAKPLRDRLLGVLGVSEALGDHLARHPRHWQALVTAYEPVAPYPAASGFEQTLAEEIWGEPGVRLARPEALRVAYRRALLTIAARDVCGAVGVTQTAAELADLADATLRAALEIATQERPGDAAACRLAVVGTGEFGGRELSYVSDVDVVFVAEARDGVEESRAVQAATRLAARLMRICSDGTAEGTIWPVVADPRPEGRDGPLVRTLSGHVAYYRRWARTWEFQPLLTARPVAGDGALGRACVDALAPMVWQAAERENFVPEMRRMRRRVVENTPVAETGRGLKPGPGGLRGIQSAVQLLQLVHGRSDESLRRGTTLDVLAALAAGGYVGRSDAAALDEAYRFLRSVEHRVQLHRLRRTHPVPQDETDLRRLGRSLGFRTEPVTELGEAWRRHAREVRRLHEKLFYRPLLEAVAGLETGQARLGSQAAVRWLEALGYADPSGALRHLEALARGVTRRTAIQRTLLPVLLGRFADSADPDAGLLGFRKVADTLGRTPWYVRLLRDEGAAAENLTRVLSAGRLAPDLLLRTPEAVALLGDPEGLRPRGRTRLEQEVLATVGRADGAEQAVAAARGVRRRELFRTAAADVIVSARLADRAVRPTASCPPPGGDNAPAAPPTPRTPRGARPAAGIPGAPRHVEPRLPARPSGRTALLDEPASPGALVDMVGDALSDITAATLAGALRAAVQGTWGDELPTRFAVIGLGRFGGHELSYGSDADVLFVHEPRAGADEHQASRAAFAVANEMRRLLQPPTADPPLLIDADLRPEGKSGPLVRTLASYAAYYRRWSLAWESQALLRAEPVAGDPGLGARFIELIDPLRYPAEGLGEDAIREIRRLKARMESERLPRGADRATHTKLGRGGLSDVEWTVQLLQMRHGAAEPGLRTTRTRRALAAAHHAGLISGDDAQTLDNAWVLAARVRNTVMLVRGRPGDTFPTDSRELAAVAHYLGYAPGHVGEMLDDYRRTTRRARTVTERLFYGYQS
ncbi:glutamate-ammonia-ligase adenylyltransferase [Streptomyces violaceusniger]|uniref:Bifunctional [glutamine synthetase] adenylyltransferase/[glutamine synthetase]-adenylyl-L-tyrosine phosphorylase n=2 Tax=Streptomyces violaceusniger group TaxID=2839105 RepID=A0ABD5JIH9_9ACTN|nr:bifunctional [glutamine synthetase] adenylyltransferase/[glutamine synthetase]-adenylyl-L-tyrosine phosphorylase [Streptomyces violaceusniger]KUL47584.1 glutamate-ammonia-ligase adenylyltransferase [Streptomyces violaceusniger]MEE4588233.1 bifunctional [glutamine synthetase] adenylyltransferase/[glutamine synthetase]-adenylyl-L-tyrosine phosphorylase [Streptomyces sp. DSM 41602]